MQTNTEIQYLQNAANYFGGTINEKFEQDKRKKNQKIFSNNLRSNGKSST